MRQPTRDYFQRRYPARGSWTSALLCRRGERERLALMRRWVPTWAGLRVLDAGCGDGAFLERLLRDRPAHLRLEDIAELPLSQARERLADCADVVEAELADVTQAVTPRHDIVLAFGLCDYVANWPGLLDRLLQRTERALYVDFPKTYRLHNHVRRWWLRRHNIHLHTGAREEVAEMLAALPSTFEMRPLSLHWIAQLTPTGQRGHV